MIPKHLLKVAGMALSAMLATACGGSADKPPVDPAEASEGSCGAKKAGSCGAKDGAEEAPADGEGGAGSCGGKAGDGEADKEGAGSCGGK